MILLMIASLTALLIAVATILVHLDYVIVRLMRHFHIFLYPDAIKLAMSLESDPAWQTYTAHSVVHPTIGRIEFHDCPSLLHLGINQHIDWKPNWIERRIIADSAQVMVRRMIREHLDRILPG
jgi:hypothetical protein